MLVGYNSQACRLSWLQLINQIVSWKELIDNLMITQYHTHCYIMLLVGYTLSHIHCLDLTNLNCVFWILNTSWNWIWTHWYNCHQWIISYFNFNVHNDNIFKLFDMYIDLEIIYSHLLALLVPNRYMCNHQDL